MLSLGWEGTDRQWRHYRRAYGLFGARWPRRWSLSVHSVVSWDFAMALVPGWHSTPLRALLRRRRHLLRLRHGADAACSRCATSSTCTPTSRDRHLDAMAKLILVTGLVLTYFYVCEVFTAWYSGDHMEKASPVLAG